MNFLEAAVRVVEELHGTPHTKDEQALYDAAIKLIISRLQEPHDNKEPDHDKQ